MLEVRRGGGGTTPPASLAHLGCAGWTLGLPSNAHPTTDRAFLVRDTPLVWQKFANGTVHPRAECQSCGSYIQYVPRIAPWTDAIAPSEVAQ